MGAKKPDLVCAPPSPIMVHTIGQMKAAGWRLTATCTKCRTRIWVDVDTIIARLGQDAFFWGRSARCKVWTWGDKERCDGRVTFAARSITGGTWVALRPDRSAYDNWRRMKEGRNLTDNGRFFLDGTAPRR